MQNEPASYNSRHIITTHAEIRVLDERCDKMKKMVKRHNVTIQNPIRKTALSAFTLLSFRVGYFAKRNFQNYAHSCKHSPNYKKIALGSNSYKQMRRRPIDEKKRMEQKELQKYFPVYWYSEW